MKKVILALTLLALVASVPMVYASTGGSSEAYNFQNWHTWQAQQKERNANFAKMERFAETNFTGSPLSMLSNQPAFGSGGLGTAGRPYVAPRSPYCQTNCL